MIVNDSGPGPIPDDELFEEKERIAKQYMDPKSVYLKQHENDPPVVVNEGGMVQKVKYILVFSLGALAGLLFQMFRFWSLT